MRRRDDDSHTIMDIAVLLNVDKCALLIQDYGGTENAQCTSVLLVVLRPFM